MKTRDKIIFLAAVICSIALIYTAGSQLDYINSQRKEMNLVIEEPLENAPPSLAFATVAMGAFRGLIVDVLWIKADNCKERGQFHDAKQIADWIVMLQPRFSGVWEFHAWNMAYNISVTIPASNPEQRWRWVKNGYELLRDRGIPLNPHDINLYRELARIFQHKIGAISDDAHIYYKLQLIEAMEPLLGPADEDFFESLAKSPKTIKEIKTDPNIVEFIDELVKTDKIFANDNKLVRNYLALRQTPLKFKKDCYHIINLYRGTETLEKFDIFAKAHQLRDEWKLEPELMQELNKTYGPVDFEDPNYQHPLDWRHPDTHALYWATKGLRLGSKEKFNVKEANTDRIVNHSLQNLLRNGRLFVYEKPYDKEQADLRPDLNPMLNKTVYQRPDFRMYEVYDKFVRKAAEKYKGKSKGTFQSMLDGHRNRMGWAVQEFYLAGHRKLALRTYLKLRKLYPDRQDLKVSLDIYIINEIRKEIPNLDIYSAQKMILPMLKESFFQYSMNEDDEALAREAMAKEIWQIYMTSYEDEEYRIGLPSFDKLQFFALMDFFNDPYYDITLRESLSARIKLERPKLMEKLKKQALPYIEEQQKQQK